MDSDSSDKKNTTQFKGEGRLADSLSDDSDVPEPDGFRCSAVDIDRIDRFFIACEFGYVLPCGIILWSLFLFFR